MIEQWLNVSVISPPADVDATLRQVLVRAKQACDVADLDWNLVLEYLSRGYGKHDRRMYALATTVAEQGTSGRKPYAVILLPRTKTCRNF